MDDANDADLLNEFADRRSDDAFRRLVERHSGMVYAACARSLSPQDAEDATQAVFILLARRAGSLRHIGALGGWLFRASRLVAAEIRRGDARRTRREVRASTVRTSSVEGSDAMPPTESSSHVRPHLDDAISRLRQKQQDAIVLHYLQGKSIHETALALRCSEDSAKKRIAYGLEKLRALLRSNGIALSVAALVPVLQSEAARSAPPALLNSCAALSHTAWASGAAAGKPALLAKGVSKTMLLLKVKIAAAVAAVLLLSSSAAFKMLNRGITPPLVVQGDKDQPPPVTPPVAAVVGDPGWDTDPFAGTLSIDISHGPDHFLVNDPAVIKSLLAVLKIESVANKMYQLSESSSILVFERGPRGPFTVNMSSDFSCSVDGGTITLAPQFFTVLSTELAKQAHAPVKLHEFAPVPGKRRPDLTVASLKSGIRSFTISYALGDQGRELDVTDPKDLEAITRAFLYTEITKRQTLDKKLAVWAGFRAGLADGSELSATFEDIDIIRTNIGNVHLKPELLNTIAAILKKYEGRELDPLRENPATAAEQTALQKATALLRGVARVQLVADEHHQPVNVEFGPEEMIPKSLKIIELQALRPDEPPPPVGAATLEMKLFQKSGEPITVTFLDPEKLPHRVILATPLDIPGVGRAWVDQKWRSIFSEYQRFQNERRDADRQNKTTARVMADFAGFKKQIFCARAFAKVGGETLIYSVNQPQLIARAVALLNVKKVTLAAAPEDAISPKDPNFEINLTPGLGFDLTLSFTSDTTAVVPGWGRVEFDAPIVPELTRIAGESAAPGMQTRIAPGAPPPSDNF